MKTQYEQKCNAAMLKSMGVGVVKSIKKNNHEKIADWIEGAKPLLMDYPDQTLGILEKICHNHGHGGIKMEGLKESNFFK
jgi:hypothetical protein